MRFAWRPAFFAALSALSGATLAARAADEPAAISDGVVKIGLILDMSGPYSDTTGIGSATAARMAVEDFGGRLRGAPIEIVVADHKGSSDTALRIARDWLDNQHVDAIMDVSGSSEAQIVQRFADTRHKIVVLNGPGAVRLSNEACTATSIHYVFNTQAIARTLGGSLVERGDKSWFFVTVDYSFGYDLERDTAAVVTQHGGTVLGDARHPLDAPDFTSYLARARQSKAQVIGLANAGADLGNAVQQAAKLGMIPGPQVFAGLVMRINQVDRLGLAVAQGMVLSESFYWDTDEATRAWSRRFFERIKKMPNGLQAGVYSSTMHYLKAVARAGTDATDPVLKIMRNMPVDDFFAHDGHIRPDGMMMHDMYLFRVKQPSESHYPWDYLTAMATVPGNEAFGSLEQSKCPLVKEQGRP